MAYDQDAQAETEIEVFSVARACLDEAGEINPAVDLLIQKMDADPALGRAILKERQWHIAHDLVRRVCAIARQVSWSDEDKPAGNNGGSMRGVDMAAWNSAIVEGLLDFRIEGGKRLREATRPEILASAAAYETRGYDQLIKGRWQRLAAQAINDDATPAGHVLTEERLAELKLEAKKLREAV